jgi:GPH family glycoside/pentoside/hexuronide:cation symporter
MGNNKTGARPFGMRDKLGYLFGDFGNDFTFILSSSFLMKFSTDIYGIDGAFVGIILMAARIVDAFTDVTMGRICDRSKLTPVGKFKPWIRRMCIPVAVASFLVYQNGIAGLPMPAKIAYLAVMYILWGSIFYTSINIPYGAMASAISAEPSDRQSLSSFRTMGGMLAGMVIMVGVPLVAYDKIDGKEVMNGGRFTLIAGVCSILAVACYMLCYTLVTERVKPEVKQEQKQDSVLVMFKKAIKNRALISIIAASITMLLAQLTMQGMANYVFPNYYGNATAQSLSSVMMMGGMVVAAIFSKPLANKFGKAEIGAVSSIAAAVINIFLFIIRPANVWIYSGLQAVSWLGLGLFSMVSWALITDVIDASEIQNGTREDGSIYALYSWARKLGQAASAGLTGILLSAIGYTEKNAFEPHITDGIYNISCLVPAIGFLLLGLILWFWYPLHKKQVDANVAILKQKHGE